MKTGLAVLLAVALCSCGGVPRTNAACSANGFRNGTQGVLTDTDLALAWSRAQQQIAQGHWIINALTCKNAPEMCVTHAPEPKALKETPNCVSVLGVHGLIDGEFIGTQDGGSVEIDLDHPPVINTAQWEFENVIGFDRWLGFDMGDR
jgi:hypothetical protein